MKWLEFSIQVDSEDVEAVAELVAPYGYGGVVIEEIPPATTFWVKAYLPQDQASYATQKRIEDGIRYLSLIRPLSPLQWRELEEEDWANAWKVHFQAHKVGERLVIVPTWQEYIPQEGELILQMDPGMAFGTGLHPTTQMCLRELEKRLEPGMTVLDLGTGSGILSIAAAKLGARAVLALDIDNVAVDVAQSNIHQNGLESVITAAWGSLPLSNIGNLEMAWGNFDLVVANIVARVITELAPELVAAPKPGGILIASGLLDTTADDVESCLVAAGARPVTRRAVADWRTLVLRTPL